MIQLATVIGHEIAHVLARHTAERVSTSMVADSGMQLLQIVSGGAQQPEFLSTHPSGTRRIQDLQGRMPLALGVAQTAKTQGRRPQCQR